MDYSEAITYLKEHDIKKDDGTFYEFGEVRIFMIHPQKFSLLSFASNVGNQILAVYFQDIPEAPERKMTDQINEPIFLCRFPVEIKSFYMQKCPEDRRLTESVSFCYFRELKSNQISVCASSYPCDSSG